MYGTGTDSSYPTYVAIMGTVFDVSGNPAYSPKNSYNGTDMPFRLESLQDLCIRKDKQLTQIPSVRRQRRLTSPGSVLTQAG